MTPVKSDDTRQDGFNAISIVQCTKAFQFTNVCLTFYVCVGGLCSISITLNYMYLIDQDSLMNYIDMIRIGLFKYSF